MEKSKENLQENPKETNVKTDKDIFIMATTQLTFKVSEQTKNNFLSIHDGLKQQEKVFTMAETLETLIREHENPATVLQDTPQTLQRLRDAETLLHDLQTKQAANENMEAEYEQKITELQAELQTAREELDLARETNRELAENGHAATEQAARLQSEMEQARNTIEKLQLKPFPARLLELTAEKLSLRYGRTITPTDILSDMFLKYTIQQYNVWFYPFVLSDKVIVSVANSINPQIKTMQQVKQLIK